MELTHIARRSGRLSSFLREELGMSMGLINRLKWQQKLLVNGIPQFTNFPVQPGDRLTVLMDEPQPQYPPETGALDILYEDAHILAVDKPAGMLIHPSRSQLTGTLANRVLGYYQKTGLACAFHPVTRLDRDTYGIVLLAKSSHIHAALSAIHPQKYYRALVLGCPAQAEGEIDAPIARREMPSLLRYVNQEGKPSLTRYQVIRRGAACCVLELQPVTGRTHQLRVHCAHMGHPILGDPQYGSPEALALSRRLGLSHQLLQAYRLVFPHPITGEILTLTSRLPLLTQPLPEEMACIFR